MRRVSLLITVLAIVAMACSGGGTSTDLIDASGPADVATTPPPATTTTTEAPTTSASTTSTSSSEPGVPSLFAITFSAEAIGVVELNSDTGEISREITGAIGEGSVSLDYVPARDSLLYSRVVTASMSEIVEVSVDGGEPSVITRGLAVDATDDGTRLAVVRREMIDGGADQVVLEVRDFDGQLIKSWSDETTPEEPVRVRNLAWSPVGETLAFEMQFEDGTQVFTLDTTSESGSIQAVASSVTTADDRAAMLSAPFWLHDGGLGVVEACCELPTFESWEVLVVDPETGERRDALFALDQPITETDSRSQGDGIALIQSHDAFGSPGDVGPTRLQVWDLDRGIRVIGEEYLSAGW